MITSINADISKKGPKKSDQITARQLTKEMVSDAMWHLVSDWQRRFKRETRFMTEAEKSKVNNQLKKLCSKILLKHTTESRG